MAPEQHLHGCTALQGRSSAPEQGPERLAVLLGRALGPPGKQGAQAGRDLYWLSPFAAPPSFMPGAEAKPPTPQGLPAFAAPPGLSMRDVAAYPVDQANAWQREADAAQSKEASREFRFACRFLFPAVDVDRDMEFELVPRLLGRGGCNTKEIAAASRGKILVRGRGSGYTGGRRTRQLPTAGPNDPLQVFLVCGTAAGLEIGQRKMTDLIEGIGVHFDKYCKKKGIRQESSFYVLRDVE